MVIGRLNIVSFGLQLKIWQMLETAELDWLRKLLRSVKNIEYQFLICLTTHYFIHNFYNFLLLFKLMSKLHQLLEMDWGIGQLQPTLGNRYFHDQNMTFAQASPEQVDTLFEWMFNVANTRSRTRCKHWPYLRWPNIVFARAFADAIFSTCMHKDFKTCRQ